MRLFGVLAVSLSLTSALIIPRSNDASGNGLPDRQLPFALPHSVGKHASDSASPCEEIAAPEFRPGVMPHHELLLKVERLDLAQAHDSSEEAAVYSEVESLESAVKAVVRTMFNNLKSLVHKRPSLPHFSLSRRDSIRSVQQLQNTNASSVWPATRYRAPIVPHTTPVTVHEDETPAPPRSRSHSKRSLQARHVRAPQLHTSPRPRLAHLRRSHDQPTAAAQQQQQHQQPVLGELEPHHGPQGPASQRQLHRRERRRGAHRGPSAELT